MICSLRSVLAVTILVSVSTTTTAAETVVWYTSNADFMEVELQDEDPAEGWVLRVHATRAGESRTLYFDGEIRGKEEIRYSSDGDPVEIRRLDPNDEEMFQVRIRYRPDGTIRSVQRCEENNCIVIRYALPGAAGRETVRGEDLLLGIRYGADARPEYIRRERPGEPVEEEWFEYERGRLHSSRKMVGAEEVLTRYADGLVIRRETRRDGRLVERITMERSADGTLLEETTVTRNRRTVERYNPGDAPGITRERLVDGELVEQEERFDERTDLVTRFREGEVLFRTWYHDGEPVRREIFQDGEIVHIDEMKE